jgi:hypothetical protein
MMDSNNNGRVPIEEFVYAYYRQQRFAKDKIAELEVEKRKLESQRADILGKYRQH